MSLKCPRCGGAVASVDDERLKCAECGALMRRKERATAPRSDAPDAPPPPAPPAPPPLAASTVDVSAGQDAPLFEGGANAAPPTDLLDAPPVPSSRRRWLLGGMAVTLVLLILGGVAWSLRDRDADPTIAGSGKGKPSDAGAASDGESEIDKLRERAERLKSLANASRKGTEDGRPKGTNIAANNPGNPIPVATPATGGPSFGEPSWAIPVDPNQHPTIDGLPVRPASGPWTSNPWTLVAPPGRHVVQLASAEVPRLVDSGSGFPDFYRKDRERLCTGGTYDFEKLVQSSLGASGVFHDPLLPHHWGNYFWQKKDPEAALRFWQHAVEVDPSFAPSHLNLAYAYAESGQQAQAENAARLATLLNVQDSFGIAGHLRELRQRLGVPLLTVGDARYAAASEDDASARLSVEQRRVMRVLTTIADCCAEPVERIRATNNIGVYLVHEKQPRIGLKHFRRALKESLALGARPEAAELRRHLLGNMEKATREAGMGEHALYARLKEAR